MGPFGQGSYDRCLVYIVYTFFVEIMLRVITVSTKLRKKSA